MGINPINQDFSPVLNCAFKGESCLFHWELTRLGANNWGTRWGSTLVDTAFAQADETRVRVTKKLHWLHVLVTDTLTWMGCHPKRGGEAFESLALLQHFKGVHDGWLPYKALACQHALRNQHHLRKLT